MSRIFYVQNGDGEYDSGVEMKSGPSYDDYDDFPLRMSYGGSNSGCGGAAHKKRNKKNQQQMYSSKHTRIRENRISSAKATPPKR
jgi:hypothetical protein